MSLKFGIYLVEQRIITPEQFCGLVKIQQEATMSAATVAIRKNMLTIRQIASIMEIQEMSSNKSFVQVAQENGYLERADIDQLLHYQQMSCPAITNLAIECGLITESQAIVLHRHFEKDAHQRVSPAALQTPVTEQAPVPIPTTDSRPQTTRAPKFKQRPIVVRQPQM